MLSKLGIVPGSWCVTTLQKLDKARIQQADFRAKSSVQQERRLKRRAAKSKHDEEKQNEADYGARAVSYTHLDVYKRQNMKFAENGKKQKCCIIVT